MIQVDGIVSVIFKVGCWCFFLTSLHAAQFARSSSTNSSNLGKYSFVLSSPSALTIPNIHSGLME